MIYDRQGYHKTLALFFLIAEVCSKGLMENRDARYGNLHSVMEYSADHNNCKSPVAVQQENVPVSILHQADEIRLKRRVRKQDKEKLSNRNKLLLMYQQQIQQSNLR